MESIQINNEKKEDVKSSKGVIYYTNFRVDKNIFYLVQDYILKANLPIVSCSLTRPLDFGKNFIYKGENSYLSMLNQIIIALRESDVENVFFCENDVLYHQSHFDFTPKEKDVFYYNVNVWRWGFKNPTAITYDNLISVSGICVNRLFALEHFNSRMAKIKELGYDINTTRDPLWARTWGYEPGKKKRNGGFANTKYETWKSEYPNIDIRHNRVFSPPRVTFESFKHKPVNWREESIENLQGWNLKELFSL